MVGDRLNRQVGETPQSKQVSAYFRVGDSKQFLLRLEVLAPRSLASESAAQNLSGFAGQDEPSNIVKKSGYDRNVPSFRVHGSLPAMTAARCACLWIDS